MLWMSPLKAGTFCVIRQYYTFIIVKCHNQRNGFLIHLTNIWDIVRNYIKNPQFLLKICYNGIVEAMASCRFPHFYYLLRGE